MHENTPWVAPTTLTQDRKDQRSGREEQLVSAVMLGPGKAARLRGERNWRGFRGWEAAEAGLWEAGGCCKLHVEITKGSR